MGELEDLAAVRPAWMCSVPRIWEAVRVLSPDGWLNTGDLGMLTLRGEAEVRDLVGARNGFKAFERVFRFRLVARGFEVGRELSHKQEVMRHAVDRLYQKEIAALFQ